MATVDIYYKIENGVLSLRNDNASGYTLFSCPNDSGNDQPNFPWNNNSNITIVTVDNNIVLPKCCYSLFSSMINLTTINHIARFDTSNVTNMNGMFNNCRSLTSLDLSNFNTSNVTIMTSMFNNCRSLTSLDLSSLDTSSVTDMMGMFTSCSLLNELDLSDLKTSNVTKMDYMFYDCRSLISLNLSDFNTLNVLSMAGMFYRCISLTTLDLSNFNTSKVHNMGDMFRGCNSLTTLDLSNFNTSNVHNMSYMFYGCNSLTTLKLSNFNASNVNDMSYMFYNCELLTGVIRINYEGLYPSISDMFKNTTKEIYLAGTSSQLKAMAQTSSKGNVKVWSINIQPYVERDNSIDTKVNIEAVINRSMFIDNDEIDIKVLQDGVDITQSLTWDKTLIINENPKTVKTAVNNVDKDTTVTFTFSVTDSYGTSSEKTVIAPTVFYTMDFLAGGKEISFGEKAESTDLYPELTTEPSDWSTNWTNYYEIVNGEYENISGISAPNFVIGTYYKKYDSLFKCAMDAEFKDFEGNLRNIYDLFYPVGSYYETSDTSFDPNDRWGGTWTLETEGQVHISGSTNGTYQINHANDNYGVGATDGGSEYIQEHSHKFTNPTVTSSGSHGHTVTIRYRTGAVARGTTESQAYANAANTSNNIAYTSGNDGAHTHSLTAGSVDEVKDVSTGQEGNMMPYIIVNRWHRVA